MKFAIMTLLLLIAAVMVGCGGKANDTTSTSGNVPTAGIEVTPGPSAPSTPPAVSPDADPAADLDNLNNDLSDDELDGLNNDLEALKW